MKKKLVKENKLLDVVEIIFDDMVGCGGVYGREDQPGVVVFRDVITDNICSVELLFFSEYPEVWNRSLDLLDMGYLRKYLDRSQMM